MLRAQFDRTNNNLVLTLEGRLVGVWAVQVKYLVSRHFVPNGLFVDISEVIYVDSVGEQLLLWLRDLHSRFVAKSCYARDVCERLQLDAEDVVGDAAGRVPSVAEAHSS
ncbi:MAG TPA: hypothetical protein VGF61_22195 [Candidatus Acidoferrum sp.]|jgi:hypothetical protein